jgi:hypothetical protein
VRGDAVRKGLGDGHEGGEAGLAAALLRRDHAHNGCTGSCREAGIHECHCGSARRAGCGHGVLGHAGLLADRHGDQAAAAGQGTEPHADAGLAGIDQQDLTAAAREAVLEQGEYRTGGGVAGDHDGRHAREGRHEGLHAVRPEAGGNVLEGDAIGVEHLHAARAGPAHGTHAEAGTVGMAHRALQFGITGVPEGLGEPHDGGRAAVRRLCHLMCGHQRELREVIHQVARERLLGRAEPLVITAEDLGEFSCVRWHGPLFRRMRARPFPLPTIGFMIVRLAMAAVLVVPGSALGATEWLPPAAVAPPTRGAGPPAVAGDDGGRAVMAWSTRDGVMAALRTPGGPWYSPVRVPGSARGAADVVAAMSPDGVAAVAWVQGGRTWASIRPAGRRFLPAVRVSTRGTVATTPRLAFGRGCQPLLAWSSDDRRGASVIRAACGRGDGGFGGLATVSPQGEQASAPAVAGGRTGVIVLWRQDGGGSYRVRSATRGLTGGFSPADTVSPTGTAVIEDPSVALAADGTAVAGWALTRGGTAVAQAATRPVTGGWTRPDDISQPADRLRGTRAPASRGPLPATCPIPPSRPGRLKSP